MWKRAGCGSRRPRGLKAAPVLLPLAALLAPHAAIAQGSASQAPQGLSYLTGFGAKNYPVVSLLWGEIVLSLAVVVIVAILVLAGLLWRRRVPGIEGLSSVPLERSGSGLPFIYVGVVLTFIALLAYTIWNYKVLAATATPPADSAFTVAITGHQWWWQVDYEATGGAPPFTTANELRIPVGKPVKVELGTADVIHSFWVPALTGKTDTIPGQHNVTWLEADRPGVYRGQCGEYCGQQHAKMAFTVVAEPQARFDAWRSEQTKGPEIAPEGPKRDAARRGEAVFMHRCAVCHTVRGTLALGRIGPDLSHLMERKTIAAGTLPNTIGALSGWIANPQHIKPGNLMPSLDLSGPELASLRDFLQTLQ
jgi:cytochrome c oxidase subunit 2